MDLLFLSRLFWALLQHSVGFLSRGNGINTSSSGPHRFIFFILSALPTFVPSKVLSHFKYEFNLGTDVPVAVSALPQRKILFNWMCNMTVVTEMKLFQHIGEAGNVFYITLANVVQWELCVQYDRLLYNAAAFIYCLKL